MSLGNLISEIKQNSRLILQKKYWYLLLVLFLCSFVGVSDHMQIYQIIIYAVTLTADISFRLLSFAIFGSADMKRLMENPGQYNYKAWTSDDGLHVFKNGRETINNNPQAESELFAVIFVVIGFIMLYIFFVILVMIFAFLFKTFLSNPVLAGKNRYILKLEQGKDDLTDIFSAFKSKGAYLNTVKVLLIKDIFVWLWSLLFVVPGVIMNLSYFMVPYIISENPGMSSKRAFEISKTVMNGEKWNLFVLYMSFIGWVLLALFGTCGISMLFVMPYVETAMMEYYIYLKNKALKMNIISEGELENRPFHYNNTALQNG